MAVYDAWFQVVSPCRVQPATGQLPKYCTTHSIEFSRSRLCLRAVCCILFIGKAVSFPVQMFCEDFSIGSTSSGTSWTRAECMEVWEAWATEMYHTSPGKAHVDILDTGYPDRMALHPLSSALRDRGIPCTVRADKTVDGVGSSTIRHILSWLYAKEVGCDWIAPDFNQGNVSDILQAGGAPRSYCHRTEYVKGFNAHAPIQLGVEPRRCAKVTWLTFFHMDKLSVPPSDLGRTKIVQVKPFDPGPVESFATEVVATGLDNVPWDSLELTFHPQHGAEFAGVVGSWDRVKRDHAKNMLHELRAAFHEHPRPGYKPPTCPYSMDRLDFAIHVRLGDRALNKHGKEGSVPISELYESYLCQLMDTISEQMASYEPLTPMFHIFTETEQPCPSRDRGTFPEFPNWPVEPEQIRACNDAKAPIDCPEKELGGKVCHPASSGEFNVIGKPIVINVSGGVVNVLGCMIAADGIAMGCSSFGVLAGILNSGIKMFSTGCSGPLSWIQNKVSPPLAVSEKGYMWVPLLGSWQTPVLENTGIFFRALQQRVAENYHRL